MEDFDKLYDQVAEHRSKANAAENYQLSNEYLKTQISLDSHKSQLIQNYEKHLRNITRHAPNGYFLNSGIPAFPPPIELPQLFVNNVPIEKVTCTCIMLKLFITRIKLKKY